LTRKFHRKNPFLLPLPPGRQARAGIKGRESPMFVREGRRMGIIHFINPELSAIIPFNFPIPEEREINQVLVGGSFHGKERSL
jgi:hypothetical protein